MNKSTILACVLSLSSVAGACPNLAGDFNFSSSSSLSVSQNQDDAGVVTYKMTVDDHNCAVCKYDNVMRADGRTVRKDYSVTNRVEYTTITCEDNRLKFRQTTDTFDSSGEKITSYSENYDYRINSDSDLVVEDIREGVPYSKTVHTRTNN